MNAQKNIEILFLIIMLFCVSCKVYKKVDWINPQLPKEERNKYFEPRQLSRITEGDSLYIKTKDSRSFDIIFSDVRNDSICGLFFQKNNKRLRTPIQTGIPISEINELKVRKFDWLTSLGVSLGVPILVWITFLIAPWTFNYGFSGI
ncbi:hypothetical protein [Algoriphagus sp.]|uniref:hypothetical protein n=1 Tax=Algoriphagus sp. TaxID=1872435 RepID=UPI0025F23D4D|nr:hypothetical protein [Algoriphagus sp.]